MLYELHYTLNGSTEAVGGKFTTRDLAQQYLKDTPSFQGAYVALARTFVDGKGWLLSDGETRAFCSKCGAEYDESQKAYFDPHGAVVGAGWHKEGCC